MIIFSCHLTASHKAWPRHLRDFACTTTSTLLSLNRPAGNGQANDPDDIAALDDSLRRIDAYAPPPEYADAPQRYATEPMIDALVKFQEQNGLKIDSIVNPGGPTERAINNRLLMKPRGAGLLYDAPEPLGGTVGNGFANRHADVAAVQRLLGALGHLPEDPFDRPHGFIDESTTEATKAFQREQGLVEDGWLAPGGETERALRDAARDLARAKGRDWLQFAERAGRAQARTLETSALVPAPELSVEEFAGSPADDQDDRATEATPATFDFRGPSYVEGGFLRGFRPSGGWPIGGGPGAPSRPIAPPPIVPPAPRSADDEEPGKTQLIPPRVPDGPFRGPDPAKPPLDSKQAQPSPYPSESPHKPEQERLAPPRIDPREYIEILPNQLDWTAHLPIVVENRQGTPPTKELNRTLGISTLKHGKEIFGETGFRQIGGPVEKPDIKYGEEFDAFRDKKGFGLKSNAAASYEDVTYVVDYGDVRMKVIINTATVEDGKPIAREDRQRAKLVMNVKDHALIIEVPKPGPGETVDLQAWDRFVEGRLWFVKGLIDNKVITADGFNQKLLDFFGRYPKK